MASITHENIHLILRAEINQSDLSDQLTSQITSAEADGCSQLLVSSSTGYTGMDSGPLQ